MHGWGSLPNIRVCCQFYNTKFVFENLEISLGRFVPWDGLSLGLFVPWDFLSLGTFCPLGPYVLGRFVLGRFVLGRFVLGRFVCAPVKLMSCSTIDPPLWRIQFFQGRLLQSGSATLGKLKSFRTGTHAIGSSVSWLMVCCVCRCGRRFWSCCRTRWMLTGLRASPSPSSPLTSSQGSATPR